LFRNSILETAQGLATFSFQLMTEIYLPPKGLGEIIGELIAAVAAVAFVVGAWLGAAALLEDIFSPPPALEPRRKSPNREPLE
jgi:hypothetical protein